MFLSETPIDLNRWNESQTSPPGVEEEREGMRGLGANPREYDDGSYGGGDAGCAQPLDVPALVDFVRSNHLPHSVIVDCSTADGVTSDHASWLSRGVHVVSGEGEEVRGVRDLTFRPWGVCVVFCSLLGELAGWSGSFSSRQSMVVAGSLLCCFVLSLILSLPRLLVLCLRCCMAELC